MGALLDLWKSERGLVAVALIAAATVMTGMSIITVDQWLDYTKWLFVTYAAAKTVTGAVGLASSQPKQAGGHQGEALGGLIRAMANAAPPTPTATPPKAG